MSLLLRKARQPILDGTNLNNYHVRIGEHSKHLTIVGECGKPLIDIYGIVFARTTPSKDEIKYAAELLDVFISKHKLTIDDYLKIKLNPVEQPEGYFETDFNYSQNKINYRSYTFEIKPFRYTIRDKDDKITIHGNQEWTDHKKYVQAKLTPAVLKKAHTRLNDYIKYRDYTESLENAKDKLNSCEI